MVIPECVKGLGEHEHLCVFKDEYLVDVDWTDVADAFYVFTLGSAFAATSIFQLPTKQERPIRQINHLLILTLIELFKARILQDLKQHIRCIRIQVLASAFMFFLALIHAVKSYEGKD